jgi:hypothetical protein
MRLEFDRQALEAKRQANDRALNRIAAAPASTANCATRKPNAWNRSKSKSSFC